MPLFRKFQLSATTSLGIWKIEETAKTLRSKLHLSPVENEYYESLHSELRKQHWLSYRNILTVLIKEDAVELFYDVFGKPHPINRKYHISVSHSGIFSAAIVSLEAPVGIDIERLKDRIERVKDKFLSAEEQSSIGDQNRLEKLYIYWGAKESLYKLNGKPDVEFGKDIVVEPFDYLQEKGHCKARMNLPEGTMDFPVYFQRIEDYMLVYSCGSIEKVNDDQDTHNSE
jgi:4'-phosphopantetheinyl transferase